MRGRPYVTPGYMLGLAGFWLFAWLTGWNWPPNHHDIFIVGGLLVGGLAFDIPKYRKSTSFKNLTP